MIPPERFGDQRRLDHRLEVDGSGTLVSDRFDEFGNLVVDVLAPEVVARIEFRAEVRVERRASEPHRLADGWLSAAYLLEPTRLTAADERLQAAAAELARSAPWGLELTDVSTTAAQALALGRGVCQDYAHVMLALCRACHLPARYVSGHLIGEGGTHAWVEVLLPADDGTGEAIAWPFDPTHASRGGLNQVSIAVGGDYADVAPTSGTYNADVAGRLTTSKRVLLTEVELAG